MNRLNVHFRGRVQGVGFRYTVMQISKGYRVTGFVRNLPDGRVNLVAEGESGELAQMLDAVKQRMEDYISDVDAQQELATGEFTAFQIRR
ncbi:MAG: acylphosphatase [Planctomycetota bacterium]